MNEYIKMKLEDKELEKIYEVEIVELTNGIITNEMSDHNIYCETLEGALATFENEKKNFFDYKKSDLNINQNYQINLFELTENFNERLIEQFDYNELCQEKTKFSILEYGCYNISKESLEIEFDQECYNEEFYETLEEAKKSIKNQLTLSEVENLIISNYEDLERDLKSVVIQKNIFKENSREVEGVEVIDTYYTLR